jgi:hypothetical protein
MVTAAVSAADAPFTQSNRARASIIILERIVVIS